MTMPRTRAAEDTRAGKIVLKQIPANFSAVLFYEAPTESPTFCFAPFLFRFPVM